MMKSLLGLVIQTDDPGQMFAEKTLSKCTECQGNDKSIDTAVL